MLTKGQKLVLVFGLWIFLVLNVLTIFQQLTYENFFILCLIGFLIIAGLFGPYTTTPKWRARIDRLITLIGMTFVVVAAGKIVGILIA